MHPTLHVTPKTALKTLFRGGKKVGVCVCVCVWGGGGGGGDTKTHGHRPPSHTQLPEAKVHAGALSLMPTANCTCYQV